ncbi:MAG: DUF975 family protein [Oscillospiraceae bacterium]|jgi:uncharacterized membrane protein
MERKAFKRKAKELLQGIWGRAVALFLCLLFLTVFFSALEKVVGSLTGYGTLETLLAPLFLTGSVTVPKTDLIYTSVLFSAAMLLSFLFITPLRQGTVCWYYGRASGEVWAVSAAFHWYTGIRRWCKALLVYLLLGLRTLCWFVLLLLPALGMYFVYGYTVMYLSVPWLSFLLLFVTFGLALVGMVFARVVCYRYFLALYILADDPAVHIRTIFRSSVRIMAGKKGLLFSLELSFLPYYLLNLLVIPLFGTVPYISMTKALYAKQFIEDYKLSVIAEQSAQAEPMK